MAELLLLNLLSQDHVLEPNNDRIRGKVDGTIWKKSISSRFPLLQAMQSARYRTVIRYNGLATSQKRKSEKKKKLKKRKRKKVTSRWGCRKASLSIISIPGPVVTRLFRGITRRPAASAYNHRISCNFRVWGLFGPIEKSDR